MSEKTNKKQLINNQDSPKFKSFDIIHEVYQQALKNADDIMGIVTEFRMTKKIHFLFSVHMLIIATMNVSQHLS